jgi:hypothetical protein
MLLLQKLRQMNEEKIVKKEWKKTNYFSIREVSEDQRNWTYQFRINIQYNHIESFLY